MPVSHLRPHVLLVEDSEDDAFFFRHALKKSALPCSLFHVADGGEAMRYLSAAHAAPDGDKPWPDLVFLDLKLPSFSGFEILEWMREQRFTLPVSVSILSGSEHAGDVQRALALGASSYRVKPISTDQLKASLGEWLAKTPLATPAPVSG